MEICHTWVWISGARGKSKWNLLGKTEGNSEWLRLKMKTRIVVRWWRKICTRIYFPEFCLRVHCQLLRLKLTMVSSMENGFLPRVAKRFLLLFWLWLAYCLPPSWSHTFFCKLQYALFLKYAHSFKYGRLASSDVHCPDSTLNNT